MTEEHRINILGEDIPGPTQPKENVQEKVAYASIIERFLALLIDYGIIFMPLQLVARIVFDRLPSDTVVDCFIPVIIGINVVFVLYETIFSCGDRVTLGKSLVGIAVMKEDASGPISFGRSFLRAMGYYISAALLGCGFVWALIDDRHRSLHDMLGGSVVVRVRRKSMLEMVALHLVGTLLLAGTCYFLYNNMWGGSRWRETLKVSQAQDFLKNMGLLEEAHKRLYGSYTTDYLRLVLLSGDPVQFQRDMNKKLSNKDFRIGVKDNTYKIVARAKDDRQTVVVYSSPQ